jgi:hypothetical protein
MNQNPPPKKELELNYWRGITLLSVPGKIMTIVVLIRKREKCSRIEKEQAGFRKNPSRVDLTNNNRE